MAVIPAINETNFQSVKERIKQAQSFGAEWVHIDVADGKFTKNILWNNPEDLENLYTTDYEPRTNFEVHLMVENPDEVLDEWLDAGVKRVIVHVESARDVDIMKMKCLALGIEFVLASNPDTQVDKLLEYKNDVDGFLVLAVNPGLAGQKFQENQLEKIKTLRQKSPDAKIEVDGGVNLETAPKIKTAGADILVAASAVWGSKSPKSAYLDLLNI